MSIQITSQVPGIDSDFIVAEVLKYLEAQKLSLIVARTQEGNFHFEVIQTVITCGNRVLEIRNFARQGRVMIVVRIATARLSPWEITFVPIREGICYLIRL